MEMGQSRRLSARAAAGTLLLVVLLASRCGKEPTPVAAAVLEPRLRELTVSSAREAELAVLVNGSAEMGFFTRGSGPLEIEIVRDGEAAVKSSLAVAGNARSAATLPLPGSGARALAVRVRAPPGTTLEAARVKDESPELPAARTIAGALRGRSLVIVACDALHARHLRCYGASRETSPEIDQLVAEGVQFTAARSQSAWTVPSVTTLFTGLEQERHAVRDVGETLDLKIPTLAEAFRAAGYSTAAFLQNKLLTRATGLDRGFDEWQEFPGESRALLLPALKKYLSAARERPSFVYVHFLPPHAPYAPPAEFSAKFGAADASVDGSVDCMARLNATEPKRDDPKVAKLAALYDNHVAYGDHLVGEVKRLVAASGADRWALFFLADHGEGFAQHGALGHNVLVHDEMVHVPMVLWAPSSALRPGSKVTPPVWMPDVVPSLAELFGLAASRDRPDLSFVGLLEGAGGAAAAPAAPRVLRLSARYVNGQPLQRAILFGEFKLVAPAGRHASALYDLARDPDETTDVSADHSVLAMALRGELAQWVAEGVAPPTGAGFTPDAELQKELRELGYVGDGGGR